VVEQFLNHIQRNKLCKASDKILLAVSGGVDSVVMLHLFVKAGFSVGVAHCNFQLRGKESDGDEQFMRELCDQMKIPVHVARFQTEAEAVSRKLSIQIAARELRYEFFETTLSEFGYNAVATAHHLNDNLETILMNLVRGTGMDGLRGIPPINGKIIRPLLFASRQELLRYAYDNALPWREDSSNATDDYQRNFIRHQIIPKLRDLNPNLEETFSLTYERIDSTIALAREQLAKISESVFETQGSRILINKKKLAQWPHAPAVLWELIKCYGFNYQQCKQLLDDHQPGKFFESSEAKITSDREVFILESKSVQNNLSVQFESWQKEIALEGKRLFIREVEDDKFVVQKQSHLAQLDADKVVFPIVWRHWQKGDAFIPLGMNTRKKISDLLIDEKVALPDKRSVTVLESAGNIIWVVGMRISETHKVTSQTKKVLIIESLPA